MLRFGKLLPEFLIRQKSKIFDTFSACGARQLLRLPKQACILPTAAHTALALAPPPAAGKLVAPGEAFLSQLQELLQATNLPITLHRADSPTHITLTLTIPKS